jgi:hypothetical protein
MTDAKIWGLKRGGHNYRKVYAAYHAATGSSPGHTPGLAFDRSRVKRAFGNQGEGDSGPRPPDERPETAR